MDRDNNDEFYEEKVRCDQIRVGDIVVLKEGEIAPADLILLSSEHENAQAFVKTTSFFGRLSMDLRTGLSMLKGHISII